MQGETSSRLKAEPEKNGERASEREQDTGYTVMYKRGSIYKPLLYMHDRMSNPRNENLEANIQPVFGAE